MFAIFDVNFKWYCGHYTHWNGFCINFSLGNLTHGYNEKPYATRGEADEQFELLQKKIVEGNYRFEYDAVKDKLGLVIID